MFYTFSQNNSGWDLIVDKELWIAHYVIIEANTEEEALKKAEEIWIYFDWCVEWIDCQCCWDRWSSYPNENKSPKIYWKDWKNYSNNFSSSKYNTVSVHYLDWSIKWKDENHLISKIK
jgi:hypothetical protein